MNLRVLYFATLRSRAGVRQEHISLPEGATVGELKRALAARHGELSLALPTALVAVNREYALAEERLHDGDEVAVFPPVSGGSRATVIRITEEALDLNALLDLIVQPETGAACVFSGVVRAVTERGQGRETTHLEYEAYQPMAEEKTRQVADEIRSRWPEIQGIAIVQRIGRLLPGTPTVLIACTAGHRDTGVFEAARFGIDRLKEIVPVWKKEVGPAGEIWVEGRFDPTGSRRGIERRPRSSPKARPARKPTASKKR